MENKDNQMMEIIDFTKLVKFIKKYIKKIVLSGLVFAIAFTLYTMLFVNKKYASEERIYLKPNVTEGGTVDINGLTSNTKMVNNFVSMLKGSNLATKVANEVNLNVEDVKSALTVTNEENTEIISVKATTTSPELSKQIVETTVNLFFEDVKRNLDIKNMTVLDQPTINKNAVSPNVKLNMILGFFIGIIFALVILIARFVLDKRLKSAKDVEEYLDITVLAEIPKIMEE